MRIDSEWVWVKGSSGGKRVESVCIRGRPDVTRYIDGVPVTKKKIDKWYCGICGKGNLGKRPQIGKKCKCGAEVIHTPYAPTPQRPTPLGAEKW